MSSHLPSSLTGEHAAKMRMSRVLGGLVCGFNLEMFAAQRERGLVPLQRVGKKTENFPCL